MKRLSFLFGLAAAACAARAEWPTYMADFSRSGQTEAAVGGALREAWRFESIHPPRPAWQGEAKWDGYNKVYDMKPRQIFDRAFHCAIVEGRVYFGSSSDDKVYCLDAATGEEIWTFYTEGPVRLAPTLHGGRAFVGSDDGCVYCLDASTGRLIWKTRIGPRDYRIPGNGRVISAWPVRTGVAVMDNIAYCAGGMFPSEGVYLCALDADTGEKQWQSEQTDLPAQGYLLASPTRLYVPAGRNNPVVYDRADGKRLRVVSGGGGTYCLLTGDTLVFGPGRRGGLGLVEPNQQDQLATFRGNHMIVSGGRSYLHGDAELSALDRARYLDLSRQRKVLSAAQGKLNERLKGLSKKTARNEAEIKRLRSQLSALGRSIDKATEQLGECSLWKVSCDFPDAMILAGDILFVGGAEGVAGYRAADGRKIWSAPVRGVAYGLAAVEGALLASTDLGVIHCFRSELQP